MGLTKWRYRRAGNIGGDWQQRVAVARTLAMNPALLLADEPTGKLVCKSAGVVFDQLRKLNREHRTAILFATHNAPLADQRDGIIEVVEGMIPASPIPVEAR